MLELFWYCLDRGKEEQNFVAECLTELGDLLKRPPATTKLGAKPLPPELEHRATAILTKEFDEGEAPFSITYYRPFRKVLHEYNDTPLLIYCKPNSNIAKAAKEECDRAVWGLCSDPPLITAVYEDGNKYILWHEALHLFDAVDCYCYANPEAGPNCELVNCLMQYEPSEDRVREWPFLCQKNIKRIQDCSKRRESNENTGK